jgi:hypothetical protein
MQLAATIAVVLSVLVLAVQARALASQSRVANEAAGTAAHREIIFHYSSVIGAEFFQRPELYAYFYGETTEPPSAEDAVRLRVIADQYASWFEAGLTTKEQLGGYAQDIGDFGAYLKEELPASPPLRSIIRENPGLWPTLDPFLAEYDASQAATLESPEA